jgi:N-methylhydantoinase A
MSQIALDRDAGRLVCAVDIGGTFTDCVILGDDGRMGYGKALSSPSDDFESGFFSSIEAGAAQLGYAGDDVFGHLTRLVSHGSTVATNAVVEGKGAKVGLLTTKGHEDTILMMRGLGRVTGEPPENVLKVTETAKPKPLVPREHIRGVAERMDCSGRVLVALNENELEAEVRQLLADGCDSFAIAFLWSIQNDAHEQRAKELIQSIAPGVFVTTSSSISKAVGEYERTVAAVINSFVGPITTRYLQKIDHKLEELGFEGNMMLMQCHGGMVPLEDSLTSPVLTIGSGPVGGLIGTQRISEMLGLGDVIATDMGGTSFDVGIITGGEPLRAEEAVLGKYRYKLPAVEVLSIGAGGGSIAWVEPHSRSLRVGPESASSNPGPA